MASLKTRQKRKTRKRRKKRQRAERFDDRYLDELERKVSRLGEFSKVELRRNIPGQEKMSEVLLDFLSPYLKDADTREAFEKLIVIGIVAWNSAILPDDRSRETLRGLTKKLSLLDRIFFKRFIKELIERKRKYFPDNKRLIASYHITDLGNDWHVSVASTLPQEIGGAQSKI